MFPCACRGPAWGRCGEVHLRPKIGYKQQDQDVTAWVHRSTECNRRSALTRLSFRNLTGSFCSILDANRLEVFHLVQNWLAAITVSSGWKIAGQLPMHPVWKAPWPPELTGRPWENTGLRKAPGVTLLNDNRWRKAMLLASILLLAATHWLVPRPEQHFHNFVYHLNFIPILMAGMLLGWPCSLLATALTVVAEFPLAWELWRDDAVYLTDQIGETAVFAAAGVVAGYLAERARRQKEHLERTSGELEKVYLELQQNLDRLRKAERMYAVAELSANLAHEIRNPLAGISGAAGILKRGNATPENVRECLEIIDKESQRLNKLLTNFLSFARPRAPRLKPTDVGSVIDSVVALAARSEEARSIVFQRRMDDPLPEVECDAEQLKQVLLNLVMNAVQATAEGAVQLDACVREKQVIIAVRDEGAGISAEQQDRIFDPFFTTKENGTGLGLAIAAKIMEQHGGALTAENVPGHGLTMMVHLPLERARLA